MLHLPAQPALDNAPLPYAEAVSRLASVRHALRLVEPFGAGPASDPSDDEQIAAAWGTASGPRQRLFDRRSEQMVGAAAAGIEALLTERQDGREPNSAASNALVERIRSELKDIAGIILR
ncbi:MAG TPA: hypothetical protein VHS33_07930 [Sphingomicrobium sp.]|jgi:hypothetical protein|nr:hypothetical protein [Sphingomicrobium sp.]